MDLYGDLDKYTNVPPTATPVGLGFSMKLQDKSSKKTPVDKKPAASPAFVAASQDTPKATETTPKNAIPSSALKFVPKLRKREDPSPKHVASRPNPIAAAQHLGHQSAEPSPSSSTSRFSPAGSLKTALGMAAFTPVSVTRKPTQEPTPISHETHGDEKRRDDRDDEYDSDASGERSSLRHFHRPADTVQEEYDPSRPNDYAAFCDDREIRRKNAEVRRDLELRERAREKARLRERAQLEKDLEAGRVPNLATTSVPGGRGRGMNLPAWMMKKIEESNEQAAPTPSPMGRAASPGQYDDAPDAPRGLGFTSSSSREPVAAMSSGVGFVAAHPSSPPPTVAPTAKPRVSRFASGFDKKKNPAVDSTSRSVLLLLNMVGPGDVDDELEGEVKEECETKYGPVKQCLIYEVKPVGTPEEAVRIFVHFEHESDAAKGRRSKQPDMLD
ncbi:Aste57867_11711 [Aphanomyces stellatus]|uniref:Aste57867_11711 protein n=1 Tax=Aphanomyces stellatus TaxID=120398 RepID=A0A485KU39_9STRA|nr:hypothetical protein As57867_011668 [Aphanomyces stellatus]VFT88568.1 Aste57867_11711 [Aphanomyces stellatus]